MPSYLKNKELYNELIICRDSSTLTTKALNMFILMVDKFAWNFRYQNPDDLQDCKQQAIMDCIMYYKSFNPDKGKNAFAYITQVIKNGYAKGWRKLHKPQFAGKLSRLDTLTYFSI